MSRNRKPRKAYKPRAIHLPMQSSTRDSIALDLHMATEAMITAPSNDTADQLASMLAAISAAIDYSGTVRILDRTDAQSLALRSAVQALVGAQERFERVGRYGVSDDEAKTLRAAAGGLDVALAGIPWNVFQGAVYTVSRAMR